LPRRPRRRSSARVAPRADHRTSQPQRDCTVPGSGAGELRVRGVPQRTRLCTALGAGVGELRVKGVPSGRLGELDSAVDPAARIQTTRVDPGFWYLHCRARVAGLRFGCVSGPRESRR
jgi:hypothetical protein